MSKNGISEQSSCFTRELYNYQCKFYKEVLKNSDLQGRAKVIRTIYSNAIFFLLRCTVLSLSHAEAVCRIGYIFLLGVQDLFSSEKKSLIKKQATEVWVASRQSFISFKALFNPNVLLHEEEDKNSPSVLNFDSLKRKEKKSKEKGEIVLNLNLTSKIPSLQSAGQSPLLFSTPKGETPPRFGTPPSSLSNGDDSSMWEISSIESVGQSPVLSSSPRGETARWLTTPPSSPSNREEAAMAEPPSLPSRGQSPLLSSTPREETPPRLRTRPSSPSGGQSPAVSPLSKKETPPRLTTPNSSSNGEEPVMVEIPLFRSGGQSPVLSSVSSGEEPVMVEIPLLRSGGQSPVLSSVSSGEEPVMVEIPSSPLSQETLMNPFSPKETLSPVPPLLEEVPIPPHSDSSFSLEFNPNENRSFHLETTLAQEEEKENRSAPLSMHRNGTASVSSFQLDPLSPPRKLDLLALERIQQTPPSTPQSPVLNIRPAHYEAQSRGREDPFSSYSSPAPQREPLESLNRKKEELDDDWESAGCQICRTIDSCEICGKGAKELSEISFEHLSKDVADLLDESVNQSK